VASARLNDHTGNQPQGIKVASARLTPAISREELKQPGPTSLLRDIEVINHPLVDIIISNLQPFFSFIFTEKCGVILYLSPRQLLTQNGFTGLQATL
jgi:hypothetical protein